jgi:hypothetical protein
MPVVVNYPPPSSVVVNEVTGAVTVVQSGKPGPQGVPGVVTATSPATYDAPTQTVGVDQTAIAIQPSQVAGTAVVDNDTRLLPAGGATGQVLAKVSGTNYDTGWRQPGYVVPPPVVGEYLIQDAGRLGYGVTPLINNEMNAGAIFVPRSITVDQISIAVTTAASAPAEGRLGIYAADNDGKPSTLIVDAGLYDATTTGTKTITLSPAVTLPQGVVFLVNCRQSTGNYSVRRFNNGGIPRPASAASSVGGNPHLWAYRQGSVSGALPSTWTGTGTETVPLVISVRIASVI